MARSTKGDTELVVEALSRMVGDHGDRFSWSISKAGRIWMTFTHWDTSKYNTSVELDPLNEPAEVPGALAALIVAHAAKCFGAGPKQDTWLDIQKTRDVAHEAMTMLREHGIKALAQPGDTPPSK